MGKKKIRFQIQFINQVNLKSNDIFNTDPEYYNSIQNKTSYKEQKHFGLYLIFFENIYTKESKNCNKKK